MNFGKIKHDIQNGKFLVLRYNTTTFFLYYDRYSMLIPIYPCDLAQYKHMSLNGRFMPILPMERKHKDSVFQLINQIDKIRRNGIISSDCSNYINSIQKQKCDINVIYLHFSSSLLQNGNVNTSMLDSYGLKIDDTFDIEYCERDDELIMARSKIQTENKKSAPTPAIPWPAMPVQSTKLNLNNDIASQLLDCDKKRCGLASYERELLFDIKAGHWDLFEQSEKYQEIDPKMVARDPRRDIKKSGVIGIDFGTKSTVVVKQEGRNEIRPIRIGSLSLSADVRDSDYENPTIVSFMDIESFLSKYIESAGRPETSCEDVFVSYNAFSDYKNCLTENFYAYFPDLKQWANNDKNEVIIQDIKSRSKYTLAQDNSLENQTVNPIEIYAYYIGLYINNMRNGIYLKYIMSFPVKYSKATKELIRKSFENGIRKSLPQSVVNDPECMKLFSVEYQISEPAAYAVTALELAGYKPENEKEKYLYGIFDFGGGTTDFDYGVWRGASDDEYERYNCDYVLECFGADSDIRLGGENILEMLAYQVFKDNRKMAAEKKIACALPVDEIPFIGGENLINNSQSANRNLTILKEALRPLWEQHEKWQDIYQKNDPLGDEPNSECIELQMYDFTGVPVPNCHFNIDTNQLIDLIKTRIKRGVDAFFTCMEKTIFNNNAAKCSSEKVYVFLAGNSSKSAFVQDIFRDTIKKLTEEYNRIGACEKEYFELILPLGGNSTDSQYVPNTKTSVAYGLVKSRPGGKIYVKKNYETDSNEETRFKYYLGGERKGSFVCKLAPLIVGENGESKVSYDIWHKFQGAGVGVARIYYTTIPGADVNKLSTDSIPYHEITFDPDENSFLFVRAISPTVIEYAIADSIENIGDKTETLDIEA